MNRRAEIAMSAAEIDAFLREERTVVVASNGVSGHPHVVPMWFALRDGRIEFWTYRKSQKVLNLRRDPRVSCLVEAGEEYGELCGVLVEGTAEIIDDPDEVLRIGAAVAEHSIGPLDDAARAGLRHTGAKRVGVIVHPTRVTSWDHRKLGAAQY